MIKTFKKFNLLLNKQKKKEICKLLLITVIGAFFEVLSISLVLPLVKTIMNPEVINTNATIADICSILNINNHQSFVLLCIVLLILVFILKNAYLLFENYKRIDFIFNSRKETQQQLLHAYLNRPYEFFISSKSGEIIRNLNSDIRETYRILMTILTLVGESVASLAILVTVFVIAPKMTLMIAMLIAIIVIIIVLAIKPKLKVKGEQLRKNVSLNYRWIIQTIHGIKDIKIAQTEHYFEEMYEKSNNEIVSSMKWQSLFSNVPKLLIECGCICSTLFVFGMLIYNGTPSEQLIPALAAFVMAAIKLIPSANRIINAVNDINYGGPAIDIVINGLASYSNDEIKENKKPLKFKKEIKFEDITFAYPNTNTKIFDKVSMTIPKGSCVGIVGKSGAGKTTAVDILLGLLNSQSGKILCDGIDVTVNYNNWLSHIGYIPQTIFMLDGTIAENVAFGNEINEKKILKVLEEAQLKEFVLSLKDGINTEVGERGIKLSGGQRQRIGIARALYKNPELLVFDEATSSLDDETESIILESINKFYGKKTMIIIAHRLQTIKNCNIVYEVKNKKLNKK